MLLSIGEYGGATDSHSGPGMLHDIIKERGVVSPAQQRSLEKAADSSDWLYRPYCSTQICIYLLGISSVILGNKLSDHLRTLPS